MPLEVGEKFPSVEVKKITALGPEDIDFAQYVAEGLSVLFCLPAAFSTTCHNDHLPGYLATADVFAQLGVDRVACLSVNDHFVMSAWATQMGTDGKVDMIADGNADLAIAMKSDMDARGGGMGTRFARLAYIVKDGEVVRVFEETVRGSTAQTGAENLIAAVKEMQADASA